MKDSGESHEAVTVWQAPDGSQWRLSYHLKRLAGRTECVGLDIRSHPDFEHPERPLRADHLRKLSFATYLTRARRGSLPRTARLMDLGRRLGGDAAELAHEASVMAEDDGCKTGRHANYTRATLERVAAVYSAAWASDDNARPTRDTAEALGIPYHATTKLVQRCRCLGLLPKTTPGFARGTEEDE